MDLALAQYKRRCLIGPRPLLTPFLLPGELNLSFSAYLASPTLKQLNKFNTLFLGNTVSLNFVNDMKILFFSLYRPKTMVEMANFFVVVAVVFFFFSSFHSPFTHK